MIKRSITWEPRPGGRRVTITEYDPEVTQRRAEEQRRHMQARCPCCGQAIHSQWQPGLYQQVLANKWPVAHGFPIPGLTTQASLLGGLWG